MLCLKNSCGNQQINVEFKMNKRNQRESSGNQCGISKWEISVEIKKNRNTKGTQEIEVDFQIEIKEEYKVEIKKLQIN
jgi:hypothetical protein